MSKASAYSKLPTKRQLVVAEAIRASVAGIFLNNSFHDPLLDSVMLTFPIAKITADLKLATIFVSTIDKTQIKAIVSTLNKLAPVIRKLIIKDVKLKYVPEVKFRVDDITEKNVHLENLLGKLSSAV